MNDEYTFDEESEDYENEYDEDYEDSDRDYLGEEDDDYEDE